MRKALRAKLILQFKRDVYPKKPYYNANDLHGKKKHEFIAALKKGEIGIITGFKIYEL